MTRFIKVSLSVVALLLVTLMVLTGCGKANEALTKAEAAEKAVAEATASLEAALANKADATKLAEEVENLTQAIQNAEKIAEEGDATLNAAIESAKKTLTENAESIVGALDVKIAGLLAEKADKEVVNAEIARLDKVILNINDATNAYIKVEDFVEFSTTAAYYAWDLEKFYNEIVDSGLYADHMDEISYAYHVANMVIYRSTSISVIVDAYGEFEEMIKKYPTIADTVYYTIQAYKNGTRNPYDGADDLYAYVADAYANATGKAKELIADYRVMTDPSLTPNENAAVETNLVLDALSLWNGELVKNVNGLSNIYPVYPTEETFGVKDAANFAAATASITNYNAAVDYVNGEFDAEVATYVAPVNFTNNVAMMQTLAGAKDAAQAVIDLGAAFGDKTVELTQTDVDAINEWNDAYEAWLRVYLPALQAHQQSGEALARYEANKALITPTVENLTRVLDELAVLAGEYKESAMEMFMEDFRANFYDITGDNGEEILGVYDPTTVKLDSYELINSIWNKAMEWKELYELNLDGICEETELEPNAVIADIIRAKEDFAKLAANALNAWNALPEIAEDADLGVYDTDAYVVLAWFDEYLGDAELPFALSSDVNVTVEYYEHVQAVEAARQAKIAALAAEKDAIDAALAALDTAKYDTLHDKIVAVTALIEAYLGDESAYDADNTVTEATLGDAGVENLNINTKYDLYLDETAAENKVNAAIDKDGDLADLDEAVTEKYEALEEMMNNLNDNYPRFDTTNTGDAADDVLPTIEDVETATEALKDAVEAFENLNGDQTGMTSTGADALAEDAEAAVAEEKRLNNLAEKKEALEDATDALVNADVLEEHLPYFADDAAKAEYEGLVEDLEAALGAYKDLQDADQAVIKAAEDALADAEFVLEMEGEFEDYEALYKKVLADINTMDDADDNKADALVGLNKIRADYTEVVEAYTDATTEETMSANFDKFAELMQLLYNEFNIPKN